MKKIFKIKFQLLIFIGALILFFNSCSKNCKEKDKTYYDIAPQIKEYFDVYQKGNWWIYENTIGTKRDCLYVESSYSEYGEEENCDSFEHSRATLKSFSSDFVSWTIESTREPKVSYCIINPLNNVIYTGGIFFFNPDSAYIYSSDNYSSNTVNLDTTINATLYQGLLINKAAQNAFAKNTGLVFCISSQDTFYLKQYHIE